MERLINTDYRRPLEALDYDEACLDELAAQVEPLELTEGLLLSLSVLMAPAPRPSQSSLTQGQQTEVKSQSDVRPHAEGRMRHSPSGTLGTVALPAVVIALPHTQASMPVLAHAASEPPVEHAGAPMAVLVGTRGESGFSLQAPLVAPLPAALPVSVPVSAPVPVALPPPMPAPMTLAPASKAGEGLQVPFNNGRVSGMLQVTLAEGHQGLLITPGHPALLEPLREPFARLDHQAWRLAEEGGEHPQGRPQAHPDEDDDDVESWR